MKMLVLGGFAAATLAFAACGGGGDKKAATTPAASQTRSDQFATTPGATTAATPGAATSATKAPSGTTPAAGETATKPAVASPAAAPTTGAKKMYKAAPPLTIDTNKKYFATIKMDIGDIRLELFAKDAPQTVNSFVFLSRDGYFDGLTFHRVIPGFVAQGGDPEGSGRGGPGYKLPDEHNQHKFVDGAMGMATSGPNTAGSQFFIDYAPQPNLDGGYTVFGQIVTGRDILDKIAPREPSTARTPGTVINTIVIEEQ